MSFAADASARLAADGKPLVSIVVAESANEPTRKTAQTLAAELEKITTTAFEVQAGDGASGIVVGTVRDDIRARLDALILYIHYVERWFDYSNASDLREAQQHLAKIADPRQARRWANLISELRRRQALTK